MDRPLDDRIAEKNVHVVTIQEKTKKLIVFRVETEALHLVGRVQHIPEMESER